jgi:hypothetical protein
MGSFSRFWNQQANIRRGVLRFGIRCGAAPCLSRGNRNPPNAPGNSPRVPVARWNRSYDYTDAGGLLLAQKVRFAPKAFKWRIPDPRRPGHFRWSLDTIAVGLYNWPALLDAKQVLVTEGEKAVERLTGLGFTATCPPAGASTWNPSWSADLWRAGCIEVIVLADEDHAGRRHAERVAASCYELARGERLERPTGDLALPNTPAVTNAVDRPLRVKLVPLSGLPPHGDVVDFLDGGHSAAEVRQIIQNAEIWWPGLEEQRRADRRRTQAAERQRRRRARLKSECDAVSRSECQEAVTLSRCHAG